MAEVVDYGYGDAAVSSPNRKDYGYGDAHPDQDYGYGDASPDVKPAEQDYGHGDARPDLQSHGCEDANPDQPVRTRDGTDYGYGDAKPDGQDYGYGDAKPDDQDYGYGDAKPDDQDYGYGDAKPDDQDYGYGDAKPDEDQELQRCGVGRTQSDDGIEYGQPTIRRFRPKRRCSITKYSLEASADSSKVKQDMIGQHQQVIDGFRNGKAIEQTPGQESSGYNTDEKSDAKTVSTCESHDEENGSIPVADTRQKTKKLIGKMRKRLSIW